MSKNRRMMILLLGIIVYTFTMGVIEDNTYLVIILSSVTLIFSALLTLNIVLRFDVRYVNKGDVHRENIYGLTLFSMPLVGAVYLYALGYLNVIGIIGLSILAVFIILYLTISYFFNYVSITEHGLSGRYLFYLERTILFKDVKHMHFSTLFNAVVLTDVDNNDFYIDIMLKDVQMILNTLTTKLEDEVVKDTFVSLAKFYKTIMVLDNLEQLIYFQKENNL